MAYVFRIAGVRLPITPSKVEEKINNRNSTTTLVNDKEVSLLKRPGLSEISFDMIIPQVEYPYAVYDNNDFKDARFFLNHLKTLKINKSVFEFKIERNKPDGSPLFDTAMNVSLEEYTISEDANEGLDLLVSVKLKQVANFEKSGFRFVEDPNKNTIKAYEKDSDRASKDKKKKYTVKKGDTLWSICKRELGSGNRYHEIAKLNGIKNPNLIRVGMVIRLG